MLKTLLFKYTIKLTALAIMATAVFSCAFILWFMAQPYLRHREFGYKDSIEEIMATPYLNTIGKENVPAYSFLIAYINFIKDNLK